MSRSLLHLLMRTMCAILQQKQKTPAARHALYIHSSNLGTVLLSSFKLLLLSSMTQGYLKTSSFWVTILFTMPMSQHSSPQPNRSIWQLYCSLSLISNVPWQPHDQLLSVCFYSLSFSLHSSPKYIISSEIQNFWSPPIFWQLPVTGSLIRHIGFPGYNNESNYLKHCVTTSLC